MRKNSLQRQTSDVSLVASQEERALLVPVTNRLSAAGQSRVLFLHRFTKDFACSCFRGDVQATCLRCFRECRTELFPRRLANSPARPRQATPPCASTRPARGMSGFRIRQVLEHALHEKGLQRQIAVGTLVKSQKRRALAVPRLNCWSNRGSTACQPPVVLLHRFT